MKASLILTALLPSCAPVTAAHPHHHVHPKSGQVVKFGPNGCLETWRSPANKCMIDTHCKEEDLTNYNVAILCVDNNGQKVRHDFGVDSFDPEETFDTSVLCHRCEAEDAVTTAPTSTAPPVVTMSPTSTAPPVPEDMHEEVQTQTAQPQVAEDVEPPVPEPVSQVAEAAPVAPEVAEPVSQVVEAAPVALSADVAEPVSQVAEAAPVALSAAKHDPKDPTWEAVSQLAETIKAMKDEMKQVSAVVATMDKKVFPEQPAQQPAAAQLARPTQPEKAVQLEEPAKFLAARPSVQQPVHVEQAAETAPALAEKPEHVALQKTSRGTHKRKRVHKAKKAHKAAKHHRAVARKKNHPRRHLATRSKRHLALPANKQIAARAKKQIALHAKKHVARHGKTHFAKKQRHHGKHHKTHHVHLEKAVETEPEDAPAPVEDGLQHVDLSAVAGAE